MVGLLGASTNPVICYVLPVIFLLRATPQGQYTRHKWAAGIIFSLVTAASLLSLGSQVASLAGDTAGT